MQVIPQKPRGNLATSIRISVVPPIRAPTALRVTEGEFVIDREGRLNAIQGPRAALSLSIWLPGQHGTGCIEFFEKGASTSQFAGQQPRKAVAKGVEHPMSGRERP